MSVRTYRKKIPVEVKAIQYFPDTLGECVQFLKDNGARFSLNWMGLEEKVEFEFFTSEGKTTLIMGDYIVCGVKGECYKCNPDIFRKTYEAVE